MSETNDDFSDRTISFRPHAVPRPVEQTVASEHLLVVPIENAQTRYVPLRFLPLTIGRGAPSEIILDSGTVSRRHFRLDQRDDSIVLTDLESTNGTFVDGERAVAPVVLNDGARIKVGDISLSYHRRVRLLILEDSQQHAELEEHALRDSGIFAQARRVGTRGDFLEALDSFRPEVIFAKYRLPDIDGLTAIELVRQRDAEVPILLVTDVLENELAVEAIKAGANDCIRKDRLERLPQAVRQALSDAAALRERRRTARALQQSTSEIEDLYNRAPCGYHSLDADGVFARVNDTELEWLGYTREEVVGKMEFAALLASESRGAFEDEFRRLKTEGAARDIELDLVRRNGGILPVLISATSVTDASGNYVMSRSIVYDMTERKRANEQLRRVNRAHRALSMCNEALVRATDVTTLVQLICQIIVDEAGYLLCWVGHAEQDAARTVRPVAQAGHDDGHPAAANITWADSESGRGPTGSCIRTGRIQIARSPGQPPRQADPTQRGYASTIAIPLGDAVRPFGALTIHSAEIEAFEAEEVRLLTDLAADLSYGIMSLRTRAERERARAEEVIREREVAIGFRIQQMLLLDEPPRNVAGLRVAAISMPSKRIAGDFYAFFTHRDHSLDLIVADVMGKGIPAALLGAAAKSHFTEAMCHLIARSPTGSLPEPREVVTLAHAGMDQHLISLESFVTLCYARVDLIRPRLELVDCGHTGVIHVRRGSGVCEIVHGDNLPLGIRAGEIFDQIAIPFEAGDVFVFFSDGITEASNPAGELFGTDRLMACVRSNFLLAPDALVDAIRDEVVAFNGSDVLDDDLTCVAVEAGERGSTAA